MPRCTVTIQSISILENGDGSSAEWRLHIWVNDQHRTWNQNGVKDGVNYPLNWEFVVDILTCDSKIRLRADGYEEDGWFLDDHDPIPELRQSLDTRTDDVVSVGQSNDDVSYKLDVRVDCATCRVPPRPSCVQITLPDGSLACFYPDTGEVIPIEPVPVGPPPGGGGRLLEPLTELPPLERYVYRRTDFLEQVQKEFLPRLSKRRAEELYRVPEEPTESDLLRIGLMRLAKSGWELAALNAEELVFRITPYGKRRQEYLRMVAMSTPAMSTPGTQ
jgi:hypothetical protein